MKLLSEVEKKERVGLKLQERMRVKRKRVKKNQFREREKNGFLCKRK